MKPFTFARGSIPRVSWFANTVVSSDSIEAQSIFITVVLICDTLIMFCNEECNFVTQRYIFKLYLHLGCYLVSLTNRYTQIIYKGITYNFKVLYTPLEIHIYFTHPQTLAAKEFGQVAHGWKE